MAEERFLSAFRDKMSVSKKSVLTREKQDDIINQIKEFQTTSATKSQASYYNERK